MTPRLVDYQDGNQALIGELYEPALPNGSAVLVVHEADGIGGNVRRRCGLLAAIGYFAFAADLHGAGRPLEGEEMKRAVDGFIAEPARLRCRTGAALDTLMKLTGAAAASTAAIGYCFGGTAVLEMARGGRELAAVASFHGLLTTRMPAAAGAVRAKVAAYTGALDPLVPAADVAAFQAEMAAAKADWQLAVYGRAWHSFTNVGVEGSPDTRMRYDPVADRLSWTAATAFLAEALQSSEPAE